MKVQVLIVAGFLVGLSYSAKGQDSLNLFQRWGKTMKVRAVEGSKENNSYRISGIGLSGAQVQDTKMAPNIYSGLGAGASLGWFNMHSKHQTLVDMEFTYNSLSFSETGGNDYSSMRAAFLISHSRFLNPKNPRWLLGGSLLAADGYRQNGYLGNSAEHNDLIIALQPRIGYQNERSILRREAFWFANFGVDLLAYLNRIPEYNLDGATSYIRPVGGFNHFRFDVGFSRAMRFSENRFGMEYSWDFYGYNEMEGLHKTRSAQHLITLNWWFKTR